MHQTLGKWNYLFIYLSLPQSTCAWLIKCIICWIKLVERSFKTRLIDTFIGCLGYYPGSLGTRRESNAYFRKLENPFYQNKEEEEEAASSSSINSSSPFLTSLCQPPQPPSVPGRFYNPSYRTFRKILSSLLAASWSNDFFVNIYVYSMCIKREK